SAVAHAGWSRDRGRYLLGRLSGDRRWQFRDRVAAEPWSHRNHRPGRGLLHSGQISPHVGGRLSAPFIRVRRGLIPARSSPPPAKANNSRRKPLIPFDMNVFKIFLDTGRERVYGCFEHVQIPKGSLITMYSKETTIVVTYLIYLLISVALTVWVARTLHKRGAIFLVDAFHGNAELAASVNHLLVVGFYLINIGFVT